MSNYGKKVKDFENFIFKAPLLRKPNLEQTEYEKAINTTL